MNKNNLRKYRKRVQKNNSIMKKLTNYFKNYNAVYSSSTGYSCSFGYNESVSANFTIGKEISK